MRIDRPRFFDAYREQFGTLTQSKVDGLEELLGLLEADPLLPADVRLVAYMLATVRHETGVTIGGLDRTYHPIEERGNVAHFRRYEPGTKLGHQLGNTKPGDGALFKGRGYVQVTGRGNARKLTAAWKQFHPNEPANFETHPELLCVARYAYFALSHGMQSGLFTGRKLTDFLNATGFDYVSARKIINGLDRAELIATYARKLEKVLRGASS